MSTKYRVIAPEGAYLNEGLREQGTILELPETFVFDKARDGEIIQPVAEAPAKTTAKDLA
jgi:hypothetical protein